MATPDEARYVEIPREMLVTGDFVTPRLNGVKYFEKPPLFYWAEALALKVFGLKEGFLRLPNVLIALLCCLATYGIGRKQYGPSIGLKAALILGLTPLFCAMAQFITLDMMVSCLITFALYSFWNGMQAPLPQTRFSFKTPSGAYSRRFWFWSFAFFCALAVLTKGLVALAIPGPVILLWLTLSKQWGKLLPAYIPSAILVFLVIALPWHILVSLKNPEFAYKYFIVEHFLRYTTTIHQRYQPFWFFVPIFLAGSLPWSLWIPSLLKESWNPSSPQKPFFQFLGIWALWVLLFFSFSSSKLIPYIVPAFPPLALLVASQMARKREQKLPFLLFPLTCFAAAIFGAVAIYFPHLLLTGKEGLIPFVASLSIACFLLGLVGLTRYHLGAICLFPLILMVFLKMGAPLAQRFSYKDIALQIKTYNQRYFESKAKTIAISFYPQELPVYLQETILLMGDKGELEFGTEVEDTRSWMIDEPRLLEYWAQKTPYFAVIASPHLEALQKKYPHFTAYPLGKDQGILIITNHPIHLP